MAGPAAVAALQRQGAMSDTLRRTLGALLLIATMGGSTVGALFTVGTPVAAHAPAAQGAGGMVTRDS